MPRRLLQEYRAARALRGTVVQSEFDQAHGVNTEGEYAGWTYLSDLDIASPNWIDARDYTAIEPERFKRVMACFDIPWDRYTFVDFGSGKGRALLLASEFPFKEIIGLEFSPELHRIAETNIGLYHSESQKCRDVQSLNVDFTEFSLPNEPLVLFFFDPCRGSALAKAIRRIGASLRDNPNPVYAAYVAPSEDVERLFQSCGFQRELFRDTEWNFIIYEWSL
jgi:SAM-dependent methyltransferase